jgi:CheY-like chemotaxis protein
MTVGEKKILLVDDDRDFVEVTKVLLESSGYGVITAHNGDDGLKRAAEEKPDLVILDVMMRTPTEGFETARALRKGEATKDIPIIMLTGVNQSVPWRFGPDEVWLPVDAFLDKPVGPERLLAEAKKAMSKESKR